MPPPNFLPGHEVQLHEPLELAASLHCLLMQATRQDGIAGRYTIRDIGRDTRGWHDGPTDGYFYWIYLNSENQGWLWQDELKWAQIPEDKRSDDWEFNHPAPEEILGLFQIGQVVQTNRKFGAWRSLNDIGYREPITQASGRYVISDIGEIASDDVEREDLEPPFVIYALENSANLRCWVTEIDLQKVLAGQDANQGK